MDAYLPPIEKPRGIFLKMAFYFTRRQFGKVMTPMKVFVARMPGAFASFYGKLASLDKKLQLPSQTAALVRERSPASTCAFSAWTRPGGTR